MDPRSTLAMLAAATRRALVFVLLFSAGVARGQEPRPAELHEADFARGRSVPLDWAWRFHAGDDPRWAEPALDDSRWEAVEPLLPPAGLPGGGWPGIGWFRRHVRFDAALAGRTLLVRVEAPGAVRVFLDGEPLPSSEGVAGKTFEAAGAAAFVVVHLPWRPEHVLAARYELSRGALAGPGLESLGFRLSLQDAGAADQERAADRRRVAVEAAFISIAALLALLHLALFRTYPKARENLYYAGSMASFAGIVVCDLETDRITSEAWREVAMRANTPFVLATIFFILLTYMAVRVGRLPRTWIGFAVAGAALAAWSWVDSGDLARRWSWYFYFGAMLVEIFRVEATVPKLPREGLPVLLRGLAILGAIIVLQILIQAGAVPPIAGISSVYVFGMLAFAVAMSLFLAGTFARTSTHLERRLVEVRALSEQVLAQERAAHEGELRRLLLEAEDARKTSELAAARHLQLSMLPASLPHVEGLETAAVMTTATEVGGDYYDFKPGGDGSLLVALGDATGHGLAAGTMVTAVKAVFCGLGVEASLPEMLAECDRVLRAMNVRPLQMCLTLARIAPTSVTVCSAAMPPVLLYRAGTGEVEELGAGGLPLGARLQTGWQDRHASLAAGDTLLLATDGLAELLAPDGSGLGFEGAAGAFRDAAGVPAGEVLERLMERVTSWRGESVPTDDLTLVAVRVSPA